MTGLQYIRKEKKLSLQDLADILGVSNQIISMWEKGSKPIPQKRLGQLSAYFGVTEALIQKDITSEEMETIAYEINRTELSTNLEKFVINNNELLKFGKDDLYRSFENTIDTLKKIIESFGVKDVSGETKIDIVYEYSSLYNTLNCFILAMLEFEGDLTDEDFRILISKLKDFRNEYKKMINKN